MRVLVASAQSKQRPDMNVGIAWPLPHRPLPHMSMAETLVIDAGRLARSIVRTEPGITMDDIEWWCEGRDPGDDRGHQWR